MCDWCGCEATGGGQEQAHGHHHHGQDGQAHVHDHHEARKVDVGRDVLEVNNLHAETNRRLLDGLGAVAFNLISSPGAGKTTLLEATLKALRSWRPTVVVEGDLQTDNDARRIQATGVPVYQINTVGGCHLDAHMVAHAFEHLRVPRHGLVFIENVGNLVCPASFDLGEHERIVLLSVTEGDDKPAKYPVAFVGSSLLLITKCDLLPYVDFSVERCADYARAVNPDLEVLQVSARTGEGLDAWLEWVRTAVLRRQEAVAEVG